MKGLGVESEGPALFLAQQAKHTAFVLHKRMKRRLRAAKFDVATALFRDIDRWAPYSYDEKKYDLPFLSSCDGGGESELPRRVFAVWTGDNPLSEARAASLQALERTIELPLVLVTPDNLDDWLIPAHPLVAGYEHLSLVHRSDYLRAYLMHYHGGGHVDIKRPKASWVRAFRDMEADPGVWVTGYETSHANWIGKMRGRVGRDILLHYRLMFGKGAFIMRSHTPLTAAWLDEVERRIEVQGDSLALNPGGIYGEEGYPFSWTDLLGRVLDPLTLKYHDRVRFNNDLLLDFVDYR